MIGAESAPVFVCFFPPSLKRGLKAAGFRKDNGGADGRGLRPAQAAGFADGRRTRRIEGHETCRQDRG